MDSPTGASAAGEQVSADGAASAAATAMVVSAEGAESKAEALARQLRATGVEASN